MGKWRAGVDIGGTFTDLALLNEKTGQITTLKYPSDRARPAASVFAGLAEILSASDAAMADLAFFSHGTTLAVNTILEYNGARTALLVTKGLRDILHIGRHRLPDIFNFFTEMPQPLVRRAQVIEIEERCLADGSIALPLTRDAMVAAVAELRRLKIEAVAVGFLHSYRNPANEEAALRWLRELMPEAYVSLSSAVWPQMREFERTLIGVMNAYVGNRMQLYFGDLERGLQDAGLALPVLSTKSNGGVMTAAEAAQRPVETLMSGPAAGAIGAAFVARTAGFPKVITIDIGGTSTDVSIIEGEPRYSSENQVGAFPVIMPAVDVTSIGAGGGSVAWVDGFGMLKVGPRSAGARPGPACYGFGGTEPTLTDAFVCLGILDADRFADGKVQIDRARARDVVGGLADRVGLGLEETAESIVRIATSQIYATLVPLLARKGVDYSEFALLAFGGAGPMHGLLVAREIGIRRAIVPNHPGVLCAIGALVADVRRDFVRTIHRRFDPSEAAAVIAAMRDGFSDLERQGRDWLDGQALTYTSRRYDRVADMRCAGQSFEISVALDPADLDDDGTRLAALFHREYEQVYGYVNQGAALEIRDIRLVAIGETPKPSLQRRTPAPSGQTAASPIEKPIFHDGRWQTARFLDRAQLSDASLPGPAVIRQYDTTTFVPAGYAVSLDEYGNLIAGAAR